MKIEKIYCGKYESGWFISTEVINHNQHCSTYKNTVFLWFEPTFKEAILIYELVEDKFLQTEPTDFFCWFNDSLELKELEKQK